jgi:hypothetical protein
VEFITSLDFSTVEWLQASLASPLLGFERIDQHGGEA